MSFGSHEYTILKNTEKMAKELGLRIAANPFHHRNNNSLSLKPNENELPIYKRDTTIAMGNIDILNAFMQGAMWARDYDTLIGLKTKQRRERSEKLYRQKKLVEKIKGKSDDQVS